MAILASPTPTPLNSHWPGAEGNLYRRPSKRMLTRTTSGLFGSKRNSPLSLSNGAAPQYAMAGGTNKASVGDSSDDEDLAPVKLSAEAREILGEEASQVSASPNTRTSGEHEPARRQLAFRPSPKNEPARDTAIASTGSPSVPAGQYSHAVRPSASVLGRDGSFYYKKIGENVRHLDMITPAPPIRTVRINGSRSQTRSPPSSSPSTEKRQDGSIIQPDSNQRYVSRSGGDKSGIASDDDVASHHPTTVQRSRRGDENGVQSTMRGKRSGKMTGSFLNGPVRRGMIRRQSEDEEASPHVNDRLSNGSPNQLQHRQTGLAEKFDKSSPHGAAYQQVTDSHHSSEKKSDSHPFSTAGPDPPSSQRELREAKLQRPIEPEPVNAQKPLSIQRQPDTGSARARARNEPVFQIPAPPQLPSSHDQENEPPPTFKRPNPAQSVLGEVRKVSVLADKKPNAAISVAASPHRQPLAPRSENTPRRPAPAPPPKMSVLEAATSNAGSTRAKKKVAWSVNGKLFTRLDCIGRGGSSRVYRVMAENYKMFALKRVNLEEADAASIIGYKGEIDLLRKLENVERVVRLFDYEINDEKGELKVLMEMGESDFNRMLNLQIKCENAIFDPSFTRHYWKEMLECVQAVHEHGIVHSDLKPANFLVVQGRLKIIDFGIANAIQDNTVNVHRENQIGTPNYMSPEALIDCNAVNGKRDPKGQLLKIGKPSDVWSLGCILYQMVYGAPPFAHIPNPHQRIMSIPNPRVAISYPANGIGGVSIPSDLLKLLRRCLERDQHLRPTIPDMLAASDPASSLHQYSRDLSAQKSPDQVLIDQPMLGQVLQKVVHYCRANPQNMPGDAMLNEWAGTFLERIGRLDESGMG